jgi:hypothetical protein
MADNANMLNSSRQRRVTFYPASIIHAIQQLVIKYGFGYAYQSQYVTTLNIMTEK